MTLPDTPPAGRTLAVAAEALFLANLLLAPALAFGVLAWLWHTRRNAPPLAANHLRQTFWVSLWGGALLVTVTLGFALLPGLDPAWMWTAAVIYFTCVHSTLILCGMFGLARAMAGKPFRYPLIGPREEFPHD